MFAKLFLWYCATCEQTCGWLAYKITEILKFETELHHDWRYQELYTKTIVGQD